MSFKPTSAQEEFFKKKHEVLFYGGATSYHMSNIGSLSYAIRERNDSMNFKLSKSILKGQKIKTKDGWRKVKQVVDGGVL